MEGARLRLGGGDDPAGPQPPLDRAVGRPHQRVTRRPRLLRAHERDRASPRPDPPDRRRALHRALGAPRGRVHLQRLRPRRRRGRAPQAAQGHGAAEERALPRHRARRAHVPHQALRQRGAPRRARAAPRPGPRRRLPPPRRRGRDRLVRLRLQHAQGLRLRRPHLLPRRLRHVPRAQVRRRPLREPGRALRRRPRPRSGLALRQGRAERRAPPPRRGLHQLRRGRPLPRGRARRRLPARPRGLPRPAPPPRRHPRPRRRPPRGRGLLPAGPGPRPQATRHRLLRGLRGARPDRPRPLRPVPSSQPPDARPGREAGREVHDRLGPGRRALRAGGLHRRQGSRAPDLRRRRPLRASRHGGR